MDENEPMQNSVKLNMAAYLMVAQCIILFIIPIPEMLSGHLVLETWPDHAKFHILWAAGLLVFVALVTAWQAWFRLRKGDVFAWWLMLCFLLFVQAPVLLAKSLYVGGPDWWLVLLGIGVPLVAVLLSGTTCLSKSK